jgi:hypothetical protein
MDLDQHRQKRSRLGSADKNNGLSQRDDTDDHHSEPGHGSGQASPTSPGYLSGTAKALQNFSIQDRQQSNGQIISQPARLSRPLLSIQDRQQSDGRVISQPARLSRPLLSPNPAAPASFLHDPSLIRNGAPTANFSFNPHQNNASGHAIPPSSFPVAYPTQKAHFPLTSKSRDINAPATRLGPRQQAFDLPLHRSRVMQYSSNIVAGPPSKQTERGAHNPPPLQYLPHQQPNLFTQPNLTSTLQVYQSYTSSSEMLTIAAQRGSRPQPIYVPAPKSGVYVPAPKSGGTINPLTNCGGTSTTQDAQPWLLSALNPARGSSQAGVPTQEISTDSRARWSNHAAATAAIPDPSISSPNHRRITGSLYPNPSLPHSPPGYPATFYTSPGRVTNAALTASRKRKRGGFAAPPIAYIYQRTNNPDFNIFDGILLYPELCLVLAANLLVDDLISLYAISKDFHTIIDTRFTTVILGQTLRKCPESSRIFPFRCYKSLCRLDPAPRIPHPHPAKRAAGEIRRVPGFKWLKMVLFREKVCHEIMTLMAEDGVPLPRRCSLALKSMWFLMDIPDNARRIGFMHITHLITDLDLYFMMCFIVKLDMRFNDPVAPNRYHGLRKLLLSQRGLVPIWRALKQRSLSNKYDVLKMWVATKFTPTPGQEDGLSMFGVPSEELGKMRMEYFGLQPAHPTGKPFTFLLRPDQLLVREVVRRKMIFSKHFLRCFLWGYVDISTMKDYEPRVWERKIKDLDDEYDDEDGRAGYTRQAGGVKEDELLDLAVKKPISILVARTPHRQLGKIEARQRKEKAVLEECMKWYTEECQQDWHGAAN